jgi:hypothetical protein
MTGSEFYTNRVRWTKPAGRAPLTRGGLWKRINRKLSWRNGVLKKSRGALNKAEYGEYYVLIDNTIYHKHVDMEELGRELGALTENEYLAD